MLTTPEKLIEFLTSQVGSGALRKDEPLSALLIVREDLDSVAEWHEELSDYSGELVNLTDQDLEEIFISLENSDAGVEAWTYLGYRAAKQCKQLREKNERYKQYLELQKEFGPLNPEDSNG